MFRIPTLPGISSDSPKLTFRNAPSGLPRLSRQNIPREDTIYWKQYWELFDSAEEVNTLITSQHIRTAFQQHPDNVRSLLTVIITRFIRVIRSATFPRPTSAAFTSPLTAWAGASVGDDTRSVLNCARVIARVLPILLEDETGWHRWLWEEGSEEDQDLSDSVPRPEPQFVIEEEEEEQNVPAPNSEEQNKEQPPSLMSQFLNALVDSLFHVGFTLSSEVLEGKSGTTYVIWTSGVGSSLAPAAPAPIPAHRSMMLLVLLATLSQPLYTSPLHVRQQPSLVLAHLSSLPRKTYLALLCSLLNTSLTTPAARYIGQVSHDEDVLRQRAAQVLLVLLCQEGERPNVFQKAIAKLHRAQDFEFLLEGIKSALDAEAAKGGFVMGVTKAVPVGRKGNGPGALETWLLTWRVMDLNKKFTNHLLSSPHLPTLISHLFSTLTTLRDSPPQFPLLRTLSYMLQTLSSNRAFAVALSSMIPHSTTPRASDAMVGTVYALLAGTNGQHAGLYQPLLVSLGNVAPYIKSLSVQSSSRLVALFQAFASPQFLIADEGNPRCVFWMVEFFAHIIHHQFSDNPNLIYAMLRAHERFHALATCTLDSALSEIERSKAAKEEYLLRTGSATPIQKNSHTPEQSRAESPEEETAADVARDEKERVRDREEALPINPDQPPASPLPPVELSEKARGKLRESSASVSSLASPILSGNASNILGYESSSGFVATDEWVRSWVQGLPLDSIQVAISELLPKIQNIKSPSNAAAFLATATLVGMLPRAPSIISRRFQWSERNEIWRTSLLWGQIYVSSGPSQGPWTGTQIRLFGIKTAPLTRRDQAIASMTNAVENMWNAIGGHNRRASVSQGRAALASSRENLDVTRAAEQRRTDIHR